MLDIKALNMALETLEEERKISKVKIIDAVEKSMAAAYQKEYGKKGQVIKCTINLETGETNFEQIKIVVDESMVCLLSKEETKETEIAKEKENNIDILVLPPWNEEKHILVSTARLVKKNAELGEEMVFPLENKEEFGRIAAQTAKQVIVQKIKEAENDSITEEFEGKEGQIVSGIVQRMERGNIFVDLGRAIGILPPEEQIKNERLILGKRIKTYLYKLESGGRAVSLRLSRTHPKFLIELFKNESSEISSGSVEIVSVAREPGSRSKIAVKSNDPRIDPIGACVGRRGVRVNSITTELSGEKIDIIEWTDEVKKNIASSLSPAKVLDIEINEEEKNATVKVLTEEQSLAIGRGGQNVRLAAKLTGWKINIESNTGETILSSDGVENIKNEIEDILHEEENKTEAEIVHTNPDEKLPREDD